MLSRNSADRFGQDTSPRSPPGMSPAKKLSPISETPASSTERANASISVSAGTGSANGHQNSTAAKPASRAAAARSSNGSSVKRIDRVTAYRCDDMGGLSRGGGRGIRKLDGWYTRVNPPRTGRRSGRGATGQDLQPATVHAGRRGRLLLVHRPAVQAPQDRPGEGLRGG